MIECQGNVEALQKRYLGPGEVESMRMKLKIVLPRSYQVEALVEIERGFGKLSIFCYNTLTVVKYIPILSTTPVS